MNSRQRRKMAKPTVSANGLSVVHKGSKGKLIATIPDICKIPVPMVGPVPVPFMNMAESKDLVGGTITVQIEGNSVAVAGSMISRSKGDKPGVLGGIISGCTEGPATTIMFSPDVVMEMRPVVRKTDKAIMNLINTVCLSGWDQEDVEGVEGREWVRFKIVEDDGSEEPKRAVSGVKMTIKLPGGKTAKAESDPNGTVAFVDIDPGKCSVELEKGKNPEIIEITDRWPVSGLATRQKHKVAVKVRLGSGLS